MMYWNDGSWGWAGWLMMIVTMLAFWGLVAWVVLTVARGADPAPRTSPAGPKSILAERFARGEIDDDEYRRRSDTLDAHNAEGT